MAAKVYYKQLLNQSEIIKIIMEYTKTQWTLENHFSERLSELEKLRSSETIDPRTL